MVYFYEICVKKLHILTFKFTRLTQNKFNPKPRYILLSCLDTTVGIR